MIHPHHRALIFDCDGTLADSMPVHWIAWHETLKAHALDHLMPFERFMGWGGVPAKTIFETLAAESGRVLDAVALTAQKYDAYFANADQIKPIAPIMALAEEYHGKLPIAVATGSTKRGVTHTLKAIEATHLFDVVVTAEDVANPKPHPETYLEAARRLGVAPADCLAFEDADPGIESARAAGMEVVDVREVVGQ